MCLILRTKNHCPCSQSNVWGWQCNGTALEPTFQPVHFRLKRWKHSHIISTTRGWREMWFKLGTNGHMGGGVGKGSKENKRSVSVLQSASYFFLVFQPVYLQKHLFIFVSHPWEWVASLCRGTESPWFALSVGNSDPNITPGSSR